MTKYYRVIKDTFLWEEGAILENYDPNQTGHFCGYKPIEDIWNKFPNQKEYVTDNLIENNPEWFERVYPDRLDKMIFHTKEELKKIISFVK